MTVLLTLALMGGCASATSMTAPAAGGSTAPSSATGSAPNASAQDLVHAAVDRFNATAGGPVQAQQRVLEGLLANGQLTQQKACPTPTTTITLDPVYARLTSVPDWHPTGGTMAGTPYALPTLIRIYTGDRITGTDLTDLHLTIDAGQVRFPAICLR